MSEHIQDENVGARLRIIRQRRGLTLLELANRSGLDISYLSRMERDALQNARPKRETVNKVLEAIGATIDEREAVYHVEQPRIDKATLDATISEIAALVEDEFEPTVLRDDRWFGWYFNRSARAVMDLREEDYPRMVGTHMLLEVTDPSIPRFDATEPEERHEVFAKRAKMFKVAFAREEFDSWYQDIEKEIQRFPWAAEIWLNPHVDSLVVERQEMTLMHAEAGRLNLRVQLNRLMSDPRFWLANWTPMDEDTRATVETLRARPEYDYDVLALNRTYVPIQ